MKKHYAFHSYTANVVYILLSFSALIWSNRVMGQSICFNSHNDYVFTGLTNAQCIEHGDFDNDGVQDIIEGSFTLGTDKMVFIKGNSNGTFQTPIVFDAGTRPYDIKAYDFNQDGNLDVVVANQYVATISVTFGNGNGTFQAPVTYTTGVTPDDIALGDFNEDGFIDIAVSCLGGGVYLFMMNAASPGAFIASGSVATGTGPRGVVIKDFNNDGHLDIATSNNSIASFGVALGTGTGTFGAATQYATLSVCYSIISGDFNGDNLPDIATSNESTNSISVAINTGSGFLPSVNYTVNSLPNGIKVGDFNEDNVLDIATVEYGDNVFSILQGTGTGTFLPAVHFTCIGAPRDLVIYDCNGDGFDDAVISTNVGQVLPVFLGLGTGNFQHALSVPVGTSPQGIHNADVNNDTFKDIVVVNTTNSTMQLLLNNGAGSFSSGGTFATGTNPTSVYAKDINGDGKMDVVTANQTGNNISVFLGNGAGSFSAANNFSANAQPIIVKIGDVNNDGFQDVVTLNATNNFNVLLGTGTGTFGAPTQYTGANNGTDLELGLLNADAYLDVVMTGGGNNKIAVSLNTGSGTFATMVETNTLTTPKGLALGDVNGDGKLDAVVACYGSNNFHRLLGNGSGGWSPITTNFTGSDTGPMDVELVDLNNDGKLDLIGICEVSVSSTGYAPVFTGNGAGAFSFYQRFSTDMGPNRLTIGDWNNDGLIDAATVNKVSNTVSILKNSTAFVTVNGPLTFCEGAGTNLTATSATTYSWSNGATTPVIAPVSSGAYTVQTWTGISGWCTSTSTPAVNVVVSSSPTLVLTNDLSICAGQSAALSVSGANNYLWSGGFGTLPNLTVTPSSTQYFVVEGFGLNGCSRKDSVLVTVVSAPDGSFTTLNPTYCQTAGVVTLVPGTAGGVFSGGGVSGSTFNPSMAPLGANTISYSVDLGGGCASNSSQTTTVIATPNANFSGLTSTFCANAAAVTLVPVQTGGTFSGTGITGNQFSPSSAGAGIFTINYSITSGGCTNSSTNSTTVFSLPITIFTGLSANYCNSDAIVTLSPTVSGGIFSGSGISGSTFNPATASLGANTITYTITDANGCTNQTSSVTNVVTQPNASFSGLTSDYCSSNTTPITLVPGTAGGIFSGPGVSGSTFTPSNGNLGTNAITYTISLGACSANSTVSTIVHAIPNANFSGLNGTYCANGTSSTLIPSIAGGTFSGTGISGSTFNPALASIGSNTVTYSITDGFGCSNSSFLTTTVVAGPSPTFTGLATNYCISNTTPVTMNPSIGGGTFSGNGISGVQFTPSNANLGTNTITYQITGSGCTNTYSLVTNIHATPIATFSGLNATYCSGDATSTLVPTQGSGIFTGSTGISGLTFNPATASIGSNTITYTIVDAFGCQDVQSLTTTVAATLPATFTGLATDYCISTTTPVTLNPTNGGGTFTGSGISGVQFTPSLATLGANTINYQIVNGTCISNYSLVTNIHATPIATFSGLNATYCSGDATSTLVPTQGSGIFTGSTGISGLTFNPATASIGSNTVTYTIVDAFGCQDVQSLTTTVALSSDPTFSGLATDYCVSQSVPVTLSTVTSGGTFTGSGMSGVQFTPSNASLGANTINYQVVNGTCISTYSLTTTVHATPNASYSGLNATYCSGDASSTLVPTQGSGTFSGSTGISGSTFNPATASIGSNFVTYTITDAFGCSGIATLSTNVTQSFDATFSGLASNYCVSQTTPVTLVPITSGGIFTGSGMSGVQFTPSTASLGLQTINYQVANGACISNYSLTTTVHAIPDASFIGLNATYCSSDIASTLTPTTSGGSFTGTGIVGLNFQPSLATIGTNFIAYTVIDAFGCTNNTTQSTSVTASYDASFTGIATDYCANENTPVDILPTTTGGTFSGAGVSGTQFTPSNANIGVNTITYNIINGACSSSSTFTTTIHVLPDASFTGLNPTFCNADQDYVLVPTQTGGVFVGPGLTGNTFNPYYAGTGNFTITYTMNDGSGCSDVDAQNIIVYSSPDASFVGLSANYCEYDVPATLIPTTIGGVFSGIGVTGNQFVPATAGVGLFDISYDISNANCTSTYTFATTVHAAPIVDYTGLNASYCAVGAGSTLVPTPLGGTFIGFGISGNQFLPAGLLGTYAIEYDYTDAFGCSGTVTYSTEVITSEDPFFSGLNASYCSDEAIGTMVPTIPGGVFTGTGVVGSTFNPATATIGINTVQYEIGSGACIGTYQVSVNVLAAPDITVNVNSNSLSVNLEFGTNYQWINCADMQAIPGATNFNFVPPFDGSFAVIATNSNCSDTSACTNYFLDIKNIEALVMSYYPNPSSGNLTIEIEETAQLEIVDMSGRIVAFEQLNIGKTNLELEHISRGMYQLFFTTNNGLRSSYPFVKN